ncbi:LysR family transcriptional regulator [Bacillus marinisedimentorum]|uniref:LysR family transcriptional regulator n=1 Tax=Bacillus marinisedimentorum TaxID=1821260 RepID=UPI0008722964|nr:LysR family transcriptional regulator [Bacillus marinisedimentorum]
MNTVHLDTFLAVARTKSFSKAAKLLNMSQPSVSHHIQTLETDFDVRLFKREPRKVELTEHGKILLRHSEELLGYIDKLAVSMKNAKQPDILRIGCSNTIGEAVISDLLNEFYSGSAFSPEQLRLKVGTSNEIADSLYNEEIDIALVEGKEDKYPFYVEPFDEDEVVLVASPAYEFVYDGFFAPSCLKKATWLIREHGCSLRQAASGYWESHNLTPASLMEFNNNQLIIESVKKGFGIAAVSQKACGKEIEKGELVIVPTKQIIKRPFFIMRRDAGFPNSLARLFWEQLVTTEEKGQAPA